MSDELRLHEIERFGLGSSSEKAVWALSSRFGAETDECSQIVSHRASQQSLLLPKFDQFDWSCSDTVHNLTTLNIGSLLHTGLAHSSWSCGLE